jgi:hypothetical protein
MSDLGSILERLMVEPLRLDEPASAGRHGSMKTSATLGRSGLRRGKPLARKTELKRRTPLSRGQFRKP